MHVLLTTMPSTRVRILVPPFPLKVDQAGYAYIGKRHGAVEQETGEYQPG